MGVGIDPVLEAQPVEGGGVGMVMGVALRQGCHQRLELLQGLHRIVPVAAGDRWRLPFRESLEEAADDASTDGREDALNARAEALDDVGDRKADAINERADEMN